MKKITVLAIAGVMTASLAATAFAEMADVKVGGEVRIRDEWKNNYTDFDKDAPDSNQMIVQRTRLNIDAKIDEKTKAYASIENNRNWGSSGPAFANTAGDSVGVYQAYVVLDKLFDQPLMLKAGRQRIALGAHRLIGANDWGPGQSFDAAILGYNADAFSVNLFSVTAVDNNSGSAKADAYLNGIYATLKSVPVTSVDLYAIQTSARSAGESFLTYGVRLNGNAANVDWDAEMALQSGDSSSTTKKSATAYWVLAGYTLPEVSNLRIGAEYDYLSGNDGSADDKAFDFLYPTKHSISTQRSIYGITDIIEGKLVGTGKAGVKAFSINASAKPADGLTLLAEYWSVSSAQEYATGKSSVGTEINLQAWYDLSKSTALHAYYAQLTPSSDYSAKTDAATDAVLQLEIKF